MEYIVGIVLALAVSTSATLVGFDRDRVFYPMLLVVIASYYALFAAMSGSFHALLAESAAMCVFLVAAAAGFKRSLWIVVAALCAHGIFDFFHDRFITDPGVPVWWPMFCLTYDLAAAAYLTWLLRRPRAG